MQQQLWQQQSTYQSAACFHTTPAYSTSCRLMAPNQTAAAATALHRDAVYCTSLLPMSPHMWNQRHYFDSVLLNQPSLSFLHIFYSQSLLKLSVLLHSFLPTVLFWTFTLGSYSRFWLTTCFLLALLLLRSHVNVSAANSTVFVVRSRVFASAGLSHCLSTGCL